MPSEMVQSQSTYRLSLNISKLQKASFRASQWQSMVAWGSLWHIRQIKTDKSRRNRWKQIKTNETDKNRQNRSKQTKQIKPGCRRIHWVQGGVKGCKRGASRCKGIQGDSRWCKGVQCDSRGCKGIPGGAMGCKGCNYSRPRQTLADQGIL